MSTHFNETDIQDKIEDIFIEGKRIEVVFDIDSEAPIVHPTEIFKCNYEHNRMLLYQTRPKILPSFGYGKMDLAMLQTLELNRKLRVGLSSDIIKFVNDYPISERVKEDLFLIEYYPPMQKINLRSTFRLRTSYRYVVAGNFKYKDKTLLSQRDFTVQDISVSGIGLLVPKKIGKRTNPVLRIEIGEEFNIKLRLKDVKTPDSEFSIATEVTVARKMMSYNTKCGFIGFRFNELSPMEQENLFQFIHVAQIYEIRSIKNL